MSISELKRNSPHPDIMWGCMFENLFSKSFKWEQRGPLFPTMTQAAAYGEGQTKDAHAEFHVVAYAVNPAEQELKFRDPNIDDPIEESERPF